MDASRFGVFIFKFVIDSWQKLPFAKTLSVDFGVIAAATDLKAREVSDQKKKHAIECCMKREV